jgi:hypothetical protein
LKVKGTRRGRGSGRSIRTENTTLPLQLRWSQMPKRAAKMWRIWQFKRSSMMVALNAEWRWMKATWDICPDSAPHLSQPARHGSLIEPDASGDREQGVAARSRQPEDCGARD